MHVLTAARPRPAVASVHVLALSARWQKVLDWLGSHGVRIAIVLVLALLVSRAGKAAINRMRRRIEGSPTASAEHSLQRSATLVTTLVTAVRVAVWSVAVLLILGEVGLNLAPLIAGAGIVGVALGFGAQSLVKDFLAGFFILLENQFGVGDSVVISAVGGIVDGRVEAMTLRTTSIHERDGTLSVVPNGNLQVVSNKSRGSGRVTVEVRVGPGQMAQDVEDRLEELCGELRRDAFVAQRVSWGPESLGVTESEDGSMVLRVAADTRPSRRDEVEAELRTRIAARFRVTPFDVDLPSPG